jgi:hypothetical protein
VSYVLVGAFRAVVLTPSVAAGDLRLDTEIMRLDVFLETATNCPSERSRF